MVNVEFTLDKFPATGALKNICGLPFGLTVQPFARSPHLPFTKAPPLERNSSLARCTECYSYINAYCGVDDQGFTCAICGAYNQFHYQFRHRYCGRQGAVPPELRTNVIEVECDPPKMDDDDEADDDNGINRPWTPPEGVPVYIAIVDTVCSEEFLDCVKTALSAALEALPSHALFGLIGFSDKIRLFDVKGRLPACRSIAVFEEGPLLVPLEDVLPLQGLLAPVGKYKEPIVMALEALEPAKETSQNGFAMAAPEPPFASPSAETADLRGQCFGTVIQAILQYLHVLGPSQSEAHSQQNHIERNSRQVRVLSFLNGAPTLGQGSLSSYLAMMKIQEKEQESSSEAPPQLVSLDKATTVEMELGSVLGPAPQVIPEQDKEKMSATSLVKAFYDQAALVAASLGVTVDLFGISKQTIGLEILASVAHYTGGGLWLYPSVVDSMMAQDLYRHLSSPQAQACLLRVRTSPEFKLSKCYGRVFKDPMYDDMYHMINCDPFDTIAMDFEYVNDNGFGTPPAAPAFVQIAFQYSTAVAVEGSDDVKLQRRMRICTVQAGIAQNPEEVYSSVRSNSVASLLFHKVMSAIAKEGRSRAALLLQDWLVIMVANYLQNSAHAKGQKWHNPASQEESTLPFDDCGALQSIPRLVYGMLRSPILLGGLVSELESQDHTVFLEHLWTTLPPSQFRTAIYPSLSSYSTPDAQAFPLHSLSHVAMQHGDVPLYLLDAFTSIIVYYKDQAVNQLTYPPDKNSLVRSTVNELRQNRRLAPHYRVIREGDPGDKLFRSFMIDEPVEAGGKLEGEAAASFTGYRSFLEWLKVAAETLLQAAKKDLAKG